jgi:ATP synthase protein I
VAFDDPGPPKNSANSSKAFAVAWALPFEMVVPMVVAGAAGYFLDRWLHTKPLLLIVLGLLGLGIGIRNLVKSASLLDK